MPSSYTFIISADEMETYRYHDWLAKGNQYGQFE